MQIYNKNNYIFKKKKTNLFSSWRHCCFIRKAIKNASKHKYLINYKNHVWKFPITSCQRNNVRLHINKLIKKLNRYFFCLKVAIVQVCALCCGCVCACSLCVSKNVSVCGYARACVYECVCVFMYVVCMHASMYVCIYVCTYVTCVCILVCV